MNSKQLSKIGVPEHCHHEAIVGIQNAVEDGLRGKAARQLLVEVLSEPNDHQEHLYFREFAKALVEDREFEVKEPVPYRTWGEEFIDDNTYEQMNQACALPHAVGAALMPDAHLGYGLPIGGVLALEGAVCPYAVGVDIACRMKLSVLDIPVESFAKEKTRERFVSALESGTVFGAGKTHRNKQHHDVMDRDWDVTRVTRENKDRAWSQLGTSGSGNHFVEFGLMTLDEPELGLEAGQYVALMSHSGSRGAGHAVCSTYSSIAQRQLPRRYEKFGRLAWLELDTPEGQEYWDAMNLMGEYAAANHAVIHRLVSEICGAEILSTVENHHNFAWKEMHKGREVIVHRKGATPAGKDVLGVIPGSMATPAYVVRGLGQEDSLMSASHGAGRAMSRKKAKDQFRFKAVKTDLAAKGVDVLSAGSDEVPMVYKNIDDVMNAQLDLVRSIARFDPKVVKMCRDESRKRRR